jgi:hypothetical protein
METMIAIGLVVFVGFIFLIAGWRQEWRPSSPRKASDDAAVAMLAVTVATSVAVHSGGASCDGGGGSC